MKKKRDEAIDNLRRRMARTPQPWEIEEEMEAIRERRRRYRKTKAVKQFLTSYHGV